MLTDEVMVDFHILANRVNVLNSISISTGLSAFHAFGLPTSYTDHKLLTVSYKATDN